MFLNSQDIVPLLDHWGITPEEVPSIIPLPPEARNRIHQQMQRIRDTRAENNRRKALRGKK